MTPTADDVRFEPVDPQSEGALLALAAYFDELDTRFPDGFDPGDTLVADAPSFRPPEGVFVLGRAEKTIVACGAVQTLEPGVAEIKRMWVAPEWRGVGLGRRMLVALEEHVVALGASRARLDTNSELIEAIAMYESAGYRSIERYNDNPFAKRWFEKRLA